MNLLLDTHVFLWLISGDPRIAPSHLQAIRDPENALFLSPVSLWECLVKHHLGKLSLPEPPETILPQLREQHRIIPLPLTENAVRLLPTLPPVHRDPFDRMLICQALEHAYTIVTVDSVFSNYPVTLLPTE